MARSLPERILARVPEAVSLYYRLLLVVGPPRTGKTGALRKLVKTEGWTLINVNMRLSQLLLDLTQKQRGLRVPRLLGDLAADVSGDVVMLDNIELLFSPELSQDPLRLLEGLSRNRTIIATWSGDFENDYLAYAEPGHPEARRYARPEAIIVRVDDNAPTGNQETA